MKAKTKAEMHRARSMQERINDPEIFVIGFAFNS